MTALSHLTANPGPASLDYHDPVFPDRTLVLHAARPRDYSPDTPVLFVHHGVARNGRTYRDYWLDLARVQEGEPPRDASAFARRVTQLLAGRFGG